jgi:hypothetical protein
MIDFLRKLWGFVRPYRGRFFLGLLCGILFGLVNGLLLGAVKVVVQLVFEGETNLHQQLESAPKWIHPLSHQMAALVPKFHAPAAAGIEIIPARRRTACAGGCRSGHFAGKSGADQKSLAVLRRARVVIAGDTGPLQMPPGGRASFPFGVRIFDISGIHSLFLSG